jgi:hypothetical protein
VIDIVIEIVIDIVIDIAIDIVIEIIIYFLEFGICFLSIQNLYLLTNKNLWNNL